MSGPFIPARAAQPIDLLQQGVAGNGWDGVEEVFKPFLKTADLEPSEDVAKFMAGLYKTAPGRAMFEYFMDISLRQPLRVTGATIEQTALLAAARQGINGFAEAILHAIAHGEQLISQSKNPTGDGHENVP
jgi:hypothetical protein